MNHSDIQTVEVALQREIQNLVTQMDLVLDDNPNMVIYCNAKILPVLQPLSRHQSRFGSSKVYAPFVQIPKNTRSKVNFSSYSTYALTEYFFVAVHYLGYDYNTHNFLEVLPRVCKKSITGLLRWAFRKLDLGEIKPLEAIDNCFRLLNSHNPMDYFYHINNTAPKRKLIDSDIKNLYFLDDLLIITSDAQYLLMLNVNQELTTLAGSLKDGFILEHGFADINLPFGNDILVTEDGLQNLDIQLYDTKYRKWDFHVIIQNRLKIAAAQPSSQWASKKAKR